MVREKNREDDDETMSKTQLQGMLEVLAEAEGLANVLRQMSGGVLDLQVTANGVSKHGPIPLGWSAANTEAQCVAGSTYHGARKLGAEMFCSVCGPLDEPGVHTQADCTTYQRQQDAEAQRAEAATLTRAATGRPQPEEGR